jgi:spermidine synthase
MNMMNRFRLEIIVFVSGATVMMLELAGSRVLAPYAGTSLVTWTSLIGTILAALALGYAWGGRLADRKNPTLRALAGLLIVSAAAMAAIAICNTPILAFFQFIIRDIRLRAVASSIVLFLPASFILGAIAPYAAKLKLVDLRSSGRTIGNLYAISTAGSIAGTFLAGFFLLSLLGNARLILLCAFLQFALSLLASRGNERPPHTVAIGIVIIAIFIGTTALSGFLAANFDFHDTDTAYNRATVFRVTDAKSGKPMRVLATEAGTIQSEAYLDSDEMVPEYLNMFRVFRAFVPSPKQTAMIGGGAYSFPKYFLRTFTDATIAVVEIDPAITSIAREYFGLRDDPRLSLFTLDGRVFLNSVKERYDVLFIDAFRSGYASPFTLTSREAVERQYQILNENGAVVMNIISAISGDRGKLLRAELATYRSIFPHVYIFAVSSRNPMAVQNIVLVAHKSSHATDLVSDDPELAPLLSRAWTDFVPQDLPILTDDKSPVDEYATLLL